MEKMREEFEAWYRGHMLHNEGEHFIIIESTIDSYKEDRDKYGYSDIQEMWLSWKTSRSTLCVELPSYQCDQHYKNGVLDANKVFEALEKAGVSYK